jgi:hypothetical protein
VSPTRDGPTAATLVGPATATIATDIFATAVRADRVSARRRAATPAPRAQHHPRRPRGRPRGRPRARRRGRPRGRLLFGRSAIAIVQSPSAHANRAFYATSDAIAPALAAGHRIATTSRVDDIERGDIVVANSPDRRVRYLVKRRSEIVGVAVRIVWPNKHAGRMKGSPR